MPPALAAALPAILGGVVAAGAGTAGGLLANKAAEKSADRHILKNPDEEFMNELTAQKDQTQPYNSLVNARRPVIFPRNGGGYG